MSLPNDFVRDSELATEILSEELCVHTIHESDHLSGSRGAPRLEYWQRHKIIGRGSYGSVRLEKCVKGRRDSQVRAVKQITIAGLPQAKSLDYSRELEAIAKFSQPKVCSAIVMPLCPSICTNAVLFPVRALFREVVRMV
jgi:hypothetical protein